MTQLETEHEIMSSLCLLDCLEKERQNYWVLELQFSSSELLR